MPTILESIIYYEADILMMIAEKWGVDLQIDCRKNIAEQLANHLAQGEEAHDMFCSLPDAEQQALQHIAANGGRIFWDQFTREFGPLREMGAARREKERPHREPASLTESLYYQGWIGRAFFESGHGIREYAFLPDEFMVLLGTDLPQIPETKLTAADDETITLRVRADDRLLDHACTMLSLLRAGLPVSSEKLVNPTIHTDFLENLLAELKLLENSQVINTLRVKSFLEAPRYKSFSILVRTWMESRSINELDYLPDLECEGGWKNRPWENRADVLAWARSLNGGGWYALEDFVRWVHQEHPDFLRCGGEYDAWIIRHIPSGEFLRGRDHWDQIEGAYLRWMASGPLAWMGILEIGKSAKRGVGVYLRTSDWAESLLTRGEVEFFRKLNPVLVLDQHGKITTDRLFPLQIRYQLTRFCDFPGERRGYYHYQISPSSLRRAEKQELKVAQLTALLHKYGKKPIPQNILTALRAWGQSHQAASVHSAVLLEVPDATLLDNILTSPHKKHILERLSPTTAAIARSSIPAVRALLIEMGVLADVQAEDGDTSSHGV